MSTKPKSDENNVYRLGVGMIVLNHENKTFAGQRIDNPEPAWQMPQGGIDEGEDIEKAMLRELEEEIGTRNVQILARTETWLTYDIPQEIARNLWGGGYKGQKQMWYLLRFLGNDSEINIHTDHPEFREWAWMEKDEVIKAAVPFKRAHYRQVFDELWVGKKG